MQLFAQQKNCIRVIVLWILKNLFAGVNVKALKERIGALQQMTNSIPVSGNESVLRVSSIAIPIFSVSFMQVPNFVLTFLMARDK